MQNVRLHVSGDGEIWVLSKCRNCGEVDKHLLRAAVAGSVVCRKCRVKMDITGATIEAIDSEVARVASAQASRSGAAYESAVPERVSEALHRDGLPGAVREINTVVPHRYTGIFVKEDVLLRNVALHDKQNAEAEVWAPFPIGNSFCSLIIGTGDPLTVREARSDIREDVRKHPAGDLVQSYCGVPLIDEEGKVLGTLCHFDEQRIDANVDLITMLRLPALLRPYLPAASPA